jgi:hypothetical protein
MSLRVSQPSRSVSSHGPRTGPGRSPSSARVPSPAGSPADRRRTPAGQVSRSRRTDRRASGPRQPMQTAHRPPPGVPAAGVASDGTLHPANTASDAAAQQPRKRTHITVRYCAADRPHLPASTHPDPFCDATWGRTIRVRLAASFRRERPSGPGGEKGARYTAIRAPGRAPRGMGAAGAPAPRPTSRAARRALMARSVGRLS